MEYIAIKSRAFTLIELVILIVVMSILTAVLIPYVNQPVSVDAQARQLMNDIRFIQYYAVTHNQRYRINFSASQYTFTNLSGATPVINPGESSSTIILETGISLATSGLSNSYIAFDSNGTPYTNSLIPGTALASAATMTLTAGSKVATVTIQPTTGYVSLS